MRLITPRFVSVRKAAKLVADIIAYAAIQAVLNHRAIVTRSTAPMDRMGNAFLGSLHLKWLGSSLLMIDQCLVVPPPRRKCASRLLTRRLSETRASHAEERAEAVASRHLASGDSIDQNSSAATIARKIGPACQRLCFLAEFIRQFFR